MAWRPSEQLIAGELDNTVLGKVTGFMHFAGVKGKVKFDLEGDFHRDIRGCKIVLKGDFHHDIHGCKIVLKGEMESFDGYMKGFSKNQKGRVGDVTAGNSIGKDENGKPIYDYVSYPYIEWYSNKNGRVILELEPDQIEIIGTPIPPQESFPINRKEQTINIRNYMEDMRKKLKKDGVPITPRERKK